MPNFNCSPLKFSEDPVYRLWCALAILGEFLARVKKYRGTSTSYGLKYSLPKKIHLGGSKVKCPTFWIVDQSSLGLFHWTRKESFSITYLSDFGYIYSFEIIVIKVLSCMKSSQILHVFGLKFF